MWAINISGWNIIYVIIKRMGHYPDGNAWGKKMFLRIVAHSPMATFTALPVGSYISGSMLYSSGWRRETQQAIFFSVPETNTHSVWRNYEAVLQLSQVPLLMFRLVLTWHPGIDGFRHGSCDAVKREGYSAGVNPTFATIHAGHPQFSVTHVHILANSILNEVTALTRGKRNAKKVRIFFIQKYLILNNWLNCVPLTLYHLIE